VASAGGILALATQTGQAQDFFAVFRKARARPPVRGVRSPGM